MLLELFIIFALMVLNGYFAMAELSVVSAKKALLKAEAEQENNPAAQCALDLAEDPGRFLSTVQVGITVTGVLAAAYGGANLSDRLALFFETVPALAAHAHEVAFAIVVVLISYFTLIIGELVPKRLALARAEAIAMMVARPMNWLSTIGAPLVWLLETSSELLLRLLGLHQLKAGTVTEEEVKTLIAEGTQSGVFAPAEQQMLEGVLRLADRSVRAIMTPTPEIVWLDVEDAPQNIMQAIRTSGYSRFPVARGALDQVLGFVHAKDLLERAFSQQPLDLSACLHEPLIVHDGMPVLRLLDLFKQSKLHVALVADEYGSVEGLVSITDILTSIAGEMPEGADSDEAGATRRDDGSWLLDGTLPIEDAEKALQLRDLRGEDDFHTLAGFMLKGLGRIPVAGDYFINAGWRFEVIDMDGRRIDKVMAIPPKSAASIEN